jgi:uncharacterized integral membrane protein
MNDSAPNEAISDNDTDELSTAPPSQATTDDTGTGPVVADPSQTPPYTHTRASGFWAAVVVGLIVLLILIIFILENGQRASVSFMGAHGHLPQGVALLLAAVIGGLFVVLAGAARILQLRNRARVQKGTRHTTKRRRRPKTAEAD